MEVTMLLTDEKFYMEVLNTDIPALALAAEHWKAGNVSEAERAFSEYIKSALRPEIYFRTPDYEQEGAISDSFPK